MDIIRYFCSGLWSSVILPGIGIDGIIVSVSAKSSL